MNKKPFVKIGLFAATSLVVANMIGTGVFTSLGFQVLGLDNQLAVLMLWIVGGIIALCGALAYGEVGITFPKSGGEYHYLSKLYHPSVGFASGWVSSLVGFSAPIALASIALGKYFSNVLDVNPTVLACGVILGLTTLHATNMKYGIKFQNVFTSLKVIFIIFVIISGLLASSNHLTFETENFSSNITSASFAVSLIYVSYAYSGWNASSYIAGEINNPQKNLPLSLLVGTGLVAILYVSVNAIFLKTVPISDLKGQLEVGFLSANQIFSINGAKMMALIISLLLVSTISAMIITGPRVTAQMGNDIKALSFFAKLSQNNIPRNAIFLQTFIAILLVLTASFEVVLTYIGFTLNLFTLLTVFGVFIIRKKKLNPIGGYRTFLYPITPLLFILMNLWILIHLLLKSPLASLAGFLTAIIGIIFYFATQKKSHPIQ